jgi:hypothetical protein
MGEERAKPAKQAESVREVNRERREERGGRRVCGAGFSGPEKGGPAWDFGPFLGAGCGRRTGWLTAALRWKIRLRDCAKASMVGGFRWPRYSTFPCWF